MVTDIIKNNAAVLNSEIEWFMRVLDTRIKLHFGHECSYKDVIEVEPPWFQVVCHNIIIFLELLSKIIAFHAEIFFQAKVKSVALFVPRKAFVNRFVKVFFRRITCQAYFFVISLRHEVFKRITTWHMKLNGNIMKFSFWECLFPDALRRWR